MDKLEKIITGFAIGVSLALGGGVLYDNMVPDKPRLCDTIDEFPQYMRCVYEGDLPTFTKVDDQGLIMLEKDGKKLYFDISNNWF